MKRAYLVIAAYALLAVLVVPVFPHFVSPNEFSRWLLAASLVEDGRVEVTRLAPLFGPRFEDLATIDGRLYANKAPATALVALPGYLAARLFAGPPAPETLRPAITAMRLCASTVPLLLLALAFVRLGRTWEVDEHRVAVLILILLFATPLFAYGLLLFSHALVAAALFGAWLALDRKHDVLAGALGGLAVAAEYPAAVPVAILLIALLVTRAWRRAALLAAGGAPFAIGLATFHQIAYGSIFGLPFGQDTLPQFRELAASGIAGVSFPSPLILARLLVDPAKGLFVFSPVLLLAIPALAAAKRRLPPLTWWTLVLLPAAQILVYAGYPNWHGGWTVGARYIVPAIPFLAAPLLLRQSSRMESVLIGWSVLAVVLTSLVFPFVPNAFAFPWASFAAPLLREGLVVPNLLHLAARPAALIVPFALVAAAAVVALRRRTGYALAGVVLALALVARPESIVQTVQRAYIAEVYFERRGALGAHPPVPLVRRRELEQRLPPPSWPF
jgi:hypothetical protein